MTTQELSRPLVALLAPRHLEKIYSKFGTLYHTRLSPKELSTFVLPFLANHVLIEVTKNDESLTAILSSYLLEGAIKRFRDFAMKSEGRTSLLLPSIQFSPDSTLRLASTLISPSSGYSWCVWIEGVDEDERRGMLREVGKLAYINEVALPNYISLEERLRLIKSSYRPVRIIETGPKVVEETTRFMQYDKVLSISTSLPVRLGCIGRALGEARPEPPPLEEITEDVSPKWTSLVVAEFLQGLPWNGGRE